VRLLDVAVVIVTYRTGELTVRSIQSVQAERSTPGINIRVVVVDNASGDAAIVSRAIEDNDWSSWVTLITAPKNGGFAYGNNLGIERACADAVPSYVYLLNPDAQVRHGAIAALARFLEAHPDAGIAGSGIENADGTDWPIAFRFPGLLSELDSGLAFGPVSRLLRRWAVAQRMTQGAGRVDWICGASMMIRPDVLAAVGGFDENYFLYFEETDFCLRASRAGFATWYVPESRVMHIRGQSTSVTDLTIGPRRLPAYWFESRRRYFAMSFGVGRAMCIDVISLLANSLGVLKQLLLGRRGSLVPCFVRDLLRHSILWPQNRRLPAPSSRAGCIARSPTTAGSGSSC
jgi:hypothetical protein